MKEHSTTTKRNAGGRGTKRKSEWEHCVPDGPRSSFHYYFPNDEGRSVPVVTTTGNLNGNDKTVTEARSRATL